MVNRVVSTKLTEEEHSKILEICNDTGITVSSMVKQAIMERIKKEDKKSSIIAEKSSQRFPENYSNSNQIAKIEFTHEGKSESERENRYRYF